MSIVIKEVTTKKELKKFINFTNKLYKDNPYYVPPLFSDEMGMIDPKVNLNLKYSDCITLLAYKDNEVVGRVRGIINHKYNKKENFKHVRFHDFDAIDDFEVTKALMDYVSNWGKENGMTELNGPIGFNDLDKQGALIEGFDKDGMFITYYNFPYYKDHFEQYGLVKDCDWVEYQVQIPKEVNPRIERITNRILSRSNFKFKEFKNKRELKPFLYEIFDMYNRAFAPLHGVVELTQEQIDQYVKMYLPFLNLDYLAVIVDGEDKVVGFGFLMPSLSEAMKKSKGRLFPFGFIPILKALKKSDVLDMYLVAVEPEYQRLGLNSLLMQKITNSAIRNGVKYAETGPELEDNMQINSFWDNYDAEIVRRRRCFIKEL